MVTDYLNVCLPPTFSPPLHLSPLLIPFPLTSLSLLQPFSCTLPPLSFLSYVPLFSPHPTLSLYPTDATTYAHFLFNAFDMDRNGSIRFEDFVIGLSVLLRGSVTEKLNWAFNLYDINKDGYITKEVLCDWLL